MLDQHRPLRPITSMQRVLVHTGFTLYEDREAQMRSSTNIPGRRGLYFSCEGFRVWSASSRCRLAKDLAFEEPSIALTAMSWTF